MRRALLVGLVLLVPSRADEVVLRSGGRIAGEVVAESADAVTLRLPHGTVVIPREKVLRIVREEPGSYLRREAGRSLARGSTRDAVELYERALAIAPDGETRAALVAALAARAAEQLELFRLEETATALVRLRELAPHDPELAPLTERLEAERRAARAAEAEARRALREGGFAEALVHLDAWRLRRPDGDPEVRAAYAAAHLGAAAAADARGDLRSALDHFRMAKAWGADVAAALDRLAPVAVLEALREGDFEGGARRLERIASRYPDPAVPRFLAAVLAHLRGDVEEAVRAYADAARLAAEPRAGADAIPYEVVRAQATATLRASIARPPQEGVRAWRDLFLDPLERDDSSAYFTVYAARADVAREAAAAADAFYERIAGDLLEELPQRTKAEIVLHPSRAAYIAADPTPEGSPLAGLTLGREPTAGVCYDTLDAEGSPLIRIEIDAGGTRWLEDTLPHELVHVVQRQGLAAFRRGHWLDEGLATLYEAPASQASRLALWRQLRDEAIPLPELLALRSTPPQRPLLFYLEAHALARFLRDRGDDRDWRRFLDAFGVGSFEDALRDAYDFESVDELERAFRSWRTQ